MKRATEDEPKRNLRFLFTSEKPYYHPTFNIFHIERNLSKINLLKALEIIKCNIEIIFLNKQMEISKSSLLSFSVIKRYSKFSKQTGFPMLYLV